MVKHHEISFPIVAGPSSSSNNSNKFWNIIALGEDEAEIIMYGEIVDSKPIDWWTGNPEPGQYITPEGFLEDLETIRNKSKVTIRLNSCGGSLYVGLSIYSQLKTLKAHKTVIIDGVAASAASIIAMAGDTIIIPTGGMLMIHNAAAGLNGYFNTSDLQEIITYLDAHDNAQAGIYKQKTGLLEDEIHQMMNDTTWLVGQEAIDKGFADELLEDNSIALSVTADGKKLLSNGYSFDIAAFAHIPKELPITKEQVPTVTAKKQETPMNTNQKPKGGSQPMAKNVEELRQEYPELVAEMEKEVKATAEEIERKRLQEIDSIASSVSAELVAEAKYDKPCTAQELSFRALQENQKAGQKHLENTKKDFTASNAADVQGSVDKPDENSEEVELNQIKASMENFNKNKQGGR